MADRKEDSQLIDYQTILSSFHRGPIMDVKIFVDNPFHLP